MTDFPLAQNEVLSAILRTDFKSFCVKVFNELNGGTEFLDNFHIDLITSQLTDMMDGEFHRLIVNIPPRYMKSIICSVALPAFLLGHDPATNIICVSYGDELALNLASDSRSIMQSAWYMELFPQTRLDQSRRAIHNFQTTKGGGRFATSTGGTLTGIGANWIIIDDPLKPQDAFSDTQREKVNEWYRSTLYSRLDDKKNGNILVIMQRLHESDLTGYLLESDPSYRHIKLPVIAEEDERWLVSQKTAKPRYVERKKGELLHPARENAEVVSGIRTSLGEYAFAGQYQQNPVPMEGGLVKERWLSYYPAPTTTGFVRLVQSWDTAAKTGADNAYSACVLLGVQGNGDVFILDCFRGKMEFPDLVKKVAELHGNAYTTYHLRPEIIIEEASSGLFIIPLLQSIHKLAPIGVKAEASKEVRMMGITPLIQSGKVKFPAFNPVWWADFSHELLTFPSSKYKDQCDALSQGITHIQTTEAIPQPITTGTPHAAITPSRTMAEAYANDPKNFRGHTSSSSPARSKWLAEFEDAVEEFRKDK